MKYRIYLPALLAAGLLFSGSVLAGEIKPAPAAENGSTFNGKPIKGKILETMDAAGYTYLQLDSPDGKIWVAIPQTVVEKGQEVTAAPGMVMTNFPSKTLNKTFDSIVFSSGLAGNTQPTHSVTKSSTAKDNSFKAALQAETGTANPHGAMAGATMAQKSGGSSTAIVPAAEVKVDKASGKNSQTVADCFAKAAKLDNTSVQVRGKVMKVSTMIMGKNWVHLQDGTGNPMKNTHDLVVTTMATPAKDTVVTMEGTLHADKDFGAGYRYDVIIEDAVIK